MALRDFTDAEITILQRLVQAEANRAKNDPRRGASSAPGLDYQTGDMYIALPPEDGIPGLTRGGESVATGSASLPEPGDTPGSAEVEIYKIGVDGDLVATGFTVTAHNLAESDFAYDWVVIARDKFGSWVVCSGTIACR